MFNLIDFRLVRELDYNTGTQVLRFFHRETGHQVPYVLSFTQSEVDEVENINTPTNVVEWQPWENPWDPAIPVTVQKDNWTTQPTGRKIPNTNYLPLSATEKDIREWVASKPEFNS